MKNRPVYGKDVAMAVQFILGRSGSGKTSLCINSIIRALAKSPSARPLVILVPEQATYQIERAILNNKNIPGYSRLCVLSFRSLMRKLLGRDTGGPEVSGIGREMIIHKILRDKGEQLEIFSDTTSKPGLAGRLAETIVEMGQCQSSPADIKKTVQHFEDPASITAKKLADISVIFEEYNRFIEGKFADPQKQLAKALGKVAGADFLKDAELWIDGFSGFTALQLKLLTAMLTTVSDSHIALCLDHSQINTPQSSLFEESVRTYKNLVEIIGQNNLSVTNAVILDKPLRFLQAKGLAHIEANLFSPPTQQKIKAKGSVQIIAAANTRSEVDYTARQIQKLVRKENYRYRDIAVIAPDIASYERYIEATFNDYEIPFFIDRARAVTGHPVIEIINSGLQIAIDGFTTSEVLAWLRTGFGGLETEQIDLLENYCLAFGIDGDDWVKETRWQFGPKDAGDFDEQEIDTIRRKATEKLLRLRDSLAGEGITAKQFICAIFDMLEAVDIRSNAAQWASGADSGQQGQFYSQLIDLFDEFTEIFGDQKSQATQYAAIICNAFSKLTLKLIPPSLDQVLIGTIDRSRHPDLKAVFLAGATQKQFPSAIKTEDLLTEDDRSTAGRYDFTLAEEKGLAGQLNRRRYLAYIAFTRPASRLYITYPLVDSSGSSTVRSRFVGDLQSLFCDLDETVYCREQSEPAESCNKTLLADCLCQRAERGALSKKFLAEICKDSRLSPAGEIAEKAIGYENSAAIDSETAKEFFGGNISCSSSRLSTFAACPYQHFAKYMLGLRERKIFAFERLDLGLFYHNVLERMFKSMQKQNTHFAKIESAKLQEMLGEQIAEQLQSDTMLANFINRSIHNRYIIDSACDVLADCVAAYSQISKAGTFVQAAAETGFGKERAFQCSFSTASGGKIYLNGRIDRIDTAEVDGKNIAVIFDYKTTAKSVGWARLYHGLDMQLAIYMLAVAGNKLNGKKIDAVAGTFYLPIEAGISKKSLSDLDEPPKEISLKATGILNGQFSENLDRDASGRSKYYNFAVSSEDNHPYSYYSTSGALKPDDFTKILDHTKSRITELAEAIFSGKIDISPYRLSNSTPCTYCDYLQLCRFDWQINRHNMLDSMGKLQALQASGGGDG